MSTKIHNGFRLSAGTDPLMFARTMRSALEAPYMAAVRSEIAEAAGWLVSSADSNGTPDGRFRPLSQAANELVEETRERDWRGLDARIFLGVDPETGRTHAIVIAPEAVRDAFAELPGVEEYAYWNSTERPDELTDADWEERRNAWDRILPGIGNVNENMLRFSLDSDQYLMSRVAHQDTEAFLPLLPTTEKRARRFVMDRISYKLVREGSDVDAASTVSFMRATTQAMDMIHHPAFTDILKTVEGLLDPSNMDLFAEGKHTGRAAARRDDMDELVAAAISQVQAGAEQS